MKLNMKYSILAFLSAAVLVFLDQVTKYLAAMHLAVEHGGTDIVLWKDVFRLQYLENRGAAFGIMQGQKVILVVVTCVVAFLLCWIFIRLPMDKRFHVLRCLITFVLAGAVGNFIDRMRFSYVVDFFYFELIDFPIFNVADIYVTCSVILFVIFFLFYYKDEDFERIWAAIRPFKKRK